MVNRFIIQKRSREKGKIIRYFIYSNHSFPTIKKFIDKRYKVREL